MRVRLGILISGNGSNLQTILDNRSEQLDVGVVIATKPTAYGIIRARRAGCRVLIVPEKLRDKANRSSSEAWIHDTLVQHKVNSIFLAGFMWVLSADFIGKWQGRLLNIHPSLLPAYKGIDGFGDAVKAGETTVGATVHEVIPQLDSGKILLQRKFEVPQENELKIGRLFLHIQENRILRDFIQRSRWHYQRMF